MIILSWLPQLLYYCFPKKGLFPNLDTNDKVYLFDKNENILSNLILHKTVIFYDSDPHWINSQVKHLINEKNNVYKNNNRSESFAMFSHFRVN